jgi:hypothetical protein
MFSGLTSLESKKVDSAEISVFLSVVLRTRIHRAAVLATRRDASHNGTCQNNLAIGRR